jgi:hypothetical protein
MAAFIPPGWLRAGSLVCPLTPGDESYDREHSSPRSTNLEHLRHLFAPSPRTEVPAYRTSAEEQMSITTDGSFGVTPVR